MGKKFDIILNEDGEKVLVASDIYEGTVKIPAGVAHIGDKVFEYRKIAKVILPKGVKTIGKYAFSSIWLQEAVLPQGLEVIGDSAFFGCSDLNSIEIPESVKYIGRCAFYGCSKLEKIDLPEGLENLGSNAFYGCFKLKHIKLPEHMKRKPRKKREIEVVEIAKDKDFFTFSDDGAGVTGVSEKKDRDIKTLYIPDGVKTVCNEAFYGLRVHTVILPDGLESIQPRAFIKCVNFKRIFIPQSVKVIGKDAFAGCKQLKIYCEGEPREGWIDKPDEIKTYYDDMTEAFNFHRSAGSFDDRYVVERKEIIRNTFNPEERPVITNISREEFLKILQDK